MNIKTIYWIEFILLFQCSGLTIKGSRLNLGQLLRATRWTTGFFGVSEEVNSENYTSGILEPTWGDSSGVG